MKKELSKIIEKAKKDKDILAVSVFGSFARGEKYNDIDICLFLKEKKTNLKMTQKRIEYLSRAPNNFDIHIFQQLPIYIKQRVLKEGKIIFSRDNKKLFDIAFAAVQEFEDFKPIYESYLEAVENG